MVTASEARDRSIVARVYRMKYARQVIEIGVPTEETHRLELAAAACHEIADRMAEEAAWLATVENLGAM